MGDFKYIYDIDINNQEMKRLRAFGDFGINESKSGMTEQQVKDILAKFDDQTKRDIVSFLCNDEGSDDGEIHSYLVDELGVPEEAAKEVIKTAEWFRLDYMDYCLKNGGEEGLYESMMPKKSFVDIRKRLQKPEAPKRPFKRDFTKEEYHALMNAFGDMHGWSKIDADGRIILNGGAEERGLYYITEDDLADLVKRASAGPHESKTNEAYVDIKRKPNSRMNEYQGKFDVTKSPKSIAAKVEPLIGQMDKMNLEEIRSKFSAIVNDKDTHASDSVRQKWNQALKFAKDKFAIMKTITNLYLAGARLAVNDSEKKESRKMSRLTEFEKYNPKK